MTSPDPTAGTVLGEEARAAVRESLPSSGSDDEFWDGVVDSIADGLGPIVAGLLSAAREAGREEGRARVLTALEREIAGVTGIAEDEYLHGYYDGLHRAANHARRPDA